MALPFQAHGMIEKWHHWRSWGTELVGCGCFVVMVCLMPCGSILTYKYRQEEKNNVGNTQVYYHHKFSGRTIAFASYLQTSINKWWFDVGTWFHNGSNMTAPTVFSTKVSVCFCVFCVCVWVGRENWELQVKAGAAQLYTKGLLIPHISASHLLSPRILHIICVSRVELQQVLSSQHKLLFISLLHSQT